mmetsp:Transcript_100995/g.320590  ORF Transcript_100995/g.320590 Transcript_100995/m.320590 type:complete len:91 (+) Transcript_100995:827-1099(+)
MVPQKTAVTTMLATNQRWSGLSSSPSLPDEFRPLLPPDLARKESIGAVVDGLRGGGVGRGVGTITTGASVVVGGYVIAVLTHAHSQSAVV